MVKVVVAKVTSKRGKRRRGKVATKRVRGLDGEFTKQFWIDGNSPTFDEDLTHVFKLNVARAIQENKFIPASPDRFRKAATKLAGKIRSSGLFDDSSKK